MEREREGWVGGKSSRRQKPLSSCINRFAAKKNVDTDISGTSFVIERTLKARGRMAIFDFVLLEWIAVAERVLETWRGKAKASCCNCDANG